MTPWRCDAPTKTMKVIGARTRNTLIRFIIRAIRQLIPLRDMSSTLTALFRILSPGLIHGSAGMQTSQKTLETTTSAGFRQLSRSDQKRGIQILTLALTVIQKRTVILSEQFRSTSAAASDAKILRPTHPSTSQPMPGRVWLNFLLTRPFVKRMVMMVVIGAPFRQQHALTSEDS